jgi:hypothetical protein
MKKSLFIAIVACLACLSYQPENVQAKTPAKLSASKAKQANAQNATFTRLVVAHRRLINQTNRLAKAARAQAKKLVQLQKLMKKLKGQIGTVYARRKPCPWGKKGKGCRLARRIERQELRLKNHKMMGGYNPHKIK